MYDVSSYAPPQHERVYGAAGHTAAYSHLLAGTNVHRSNTAEVHRVSLGEAVSVGAGVVHMRVEHIDQGYEAHGVHPFLAGVPDAETV